MLRLPQDAFVGSGKHGLPDRETLAGTVEEYAAARAAAVDHETRAAACWGLVARGAQSLDWCRQHLLSSDPDLAEDAAGVLAWIGCPPALAQQLSRQLRRMPEGARDLLTILLRPPRATGPAAYDGVPLHGEGEPFTSKLYFVDSGYERFVAEHADWMGERSAAHSSREITGTLAELIRTLEPVVMPSFRYLLAETRSSWTAVISQASDLNWVDYFASRLRTRVIRTSHAPHVARAGRVVRHGDTSFTLTDGTRDDLQPLHCVRAIQASHQSSGWEWSARGEVQPFEELDAYTQRRVRDRFDVARLNRYCHALGIRREEAEFYGLRATLIEDDTTRWHRAPGPGVPSSVWRAEHS